MFLMSSVIMKIFRCFARITLHDLKTFQNSPQYVDDVTNVLLSFVEDIF